MNEMKKCCINFKIILSFANIRPIIKLCLSTEMERINNSDRFCNRNCNPCVKWANVKSLKQILWNHF